MEWVTPGLLVMYKERIIKSVVSNLMVGSIIQVGLKKRNFSPTTAICKLFFIVNLQTIKTL